MQFLTFDTTKQQLDGTKKVIRFARVGVYVAGSGYQTLATGVINGETNAAQNPVEADYNGQASVGADGTFDVRITDQDGGDPIDYRNITWADIAQQRAETVSARNETVEAAAAVGEARTATQELRDETAGLVESAGLLAGIYADDAAGIAATTSGKQFLVRTADPQVYNKRTNVAGSPVADGQVTIASKTDMVLIDQIGRAVQQECRDRSRMPSSA
eukprot:TRINITY_DN28139_c0_g2_i2.p1 TRINITY_DN28139_c0_g2~~TRINITY_DN28139_c0_g2_i2.p1  ORF type:complete len:216 (-),score=53.22 TRINITY_DN28139_c0_g2_i2:11-658(-)